MSKIQFGSFFASAEFRYTHVVNALALSGNEEIIARNEHLIWKPQEGLTENNIEWLFMFGYSLNIKN